MISALFYLLFHSWKNRALLRLRRLKQPKYLLGAIFGAAYFYFYFFRWIFVPSGFNARGGGVPVFPMTPDTVYLWECFGATLLGSFVLIGWVFPHQRAALVFTEAEVAFLFPAPVSRPMLIHYKLVRSQLGILFTTVMLSLITGRFGHGGSGLFRVLSWWLILSTLNLHLLAASFVRTMLLDHGVSNRMRRLVVLGVVGGLALWIGVWGWQTIPKPPSLTDDIKEVSETIKYYAEALTRFGPVPYLLWPFRLVVRPYWTHDLTHFLMAAWPVLILLAVHYVWVVRADVAFEEASVDASRKLAEKVAAIRSGNRQALAKTARAKKPPFKLAPTGLPSVALLWKNLIAAGQGFTFRFWLMILWIIVVIGFVTHSENQHAESLGTILFPIALGLLAMSLLMGPQLVRQDFRHDLQMTDVLKTYPLPAWQIALGELLTPVVILTAVQWCLILLTLILVPSMGKLEFSVLTRLAYGFSLALVTPALNMVSMFIPNAAVLLFPGWFQPSKDGHAGIEVTGQRLIFALGQFLAFIVALIPVSLLVTVVVISGKVFNLPLNLLVPVAAVGSAIILGVEAALGLVLLGKLFTRLDLGREQLPG